jgi:hypothetical protein
MWRASAVSGRSARRGRRSAVGDSDKLFEMGRYGQKTRQLVSLRSRQSQPDRIR